VIIYELIDNVAYPDETLNDFDSRVLFEDRLGYLRKELSTLKDGVGRLNFQDTLNELEKRWEKRQERLEQDPFSVYHRLRKVFTAQIA